MVFLLTGLNLRRIDGPIVSSLGKAPEKTFLDRAGVKKSGSGSRRVFLSISQSWQGIRAMSPKVS